MVKAIVVGAINWDINLFVERFPRKGEEIVVKKIDRVPGGKGGNVAVAAARLMRRNESAIIGGLGKDHVGTEQVRIFEQEGVVVSGLKFSENVESGQAYIVIDSVGANIIHTYFGANATVMPEDLDAPARRELISEARVVTIMDPLFETAIKLSREARRLGKILVWDPGVKSELGIRNARPVLENIDYIIANEAEVENLTGTSDPDLASARLAELSQRLRVVAKQGSKGCILYHDGKRRRFPSLDLEVLGMRVVNTVGCGDAFLGAFVAAISEGRPDEEALRWGNCAGGLKATRPETRGSPTRETLLNHLKYCPE